MIEMIMFFTAGMAVGSLLNLIITKWAEYARIRSICRNMSSYDEELRKMAKALKERREESE